MTGTKLILEKTCCASFIFLIALGFAYYPLRNSKAIIDQRLASFCNAFAGGLLVAACLFHILPESAALYADGSKLSDKDFPWVNFTALSSFLLLFFIELIIDDSNQATQAELNYQEPEEEELIESSFKIYQKEEKMPLWPFVFVLAISIHSVFEGLALGLSSSRFEIFAYLLAIGLHKWAIALAIGMSFASEGIERNWSIFCIMIFAIATPSGILSGLFLDGMGNKLNGLLNAVSAGTFLYIGLVEMLGTAFDSKEDKFKKIGLVLIGSGLMVSIHFVENMA